MSDKPVFFVKNLGGAPFNQQDSEGRKIFLPTGAQVTIYDPKLRQKYERNPGWYEVSDTPDELVPDADPLAIAPTALKLESEGLSFVQVADKSVGTIALQDGNEASLREVLEGLRQDGKIEVKPKGRGKGLTLWPGTESAVTFKSVEAILDGLEDDPGLLLPQG